VPSPREHDEQARRNEDFYRNDLGGSDATRPEWAMTALFYTAVHLIAAFMARQRPFLASRGVQKLPRQHVERVALLDRYWPTLAGLYRALEGWSRSARYDCARFSPEELKAAEKTVADVRAEIARLHKAGGVNPPKR
jgi:hypothetical protein